MTTADINIPVDTLKKVGSIPKGFAISIKAFTEISQAVNFEIGHPRGMWAISFPQYMVVDVDLSKAAQQ